MEIPTDQNEFYQFFNQAPTCEKCGLPYWDDHRSTVNKLTCKCQIQNHFLLGWKCPNCGGGVAPGVTRCPCVPLPISFT